MRRGACGSHTGNGSDMARDGTRDFVQVKIELRHIEPAVWRRVQVPADWSLRRLHDVIQAAMGWLDYHLHEFKAGGALYGQPEIAGKDHTGPPLRSDRNVSLADLLERGVKRFTYLYDFGDEWQADIRMERTLEIPEATKHPVLVAGERRGPPDDSGGPFGYMAKLDALADPSDPDHEDASDWLGETFDAEDMDRAAIEAALARMRVARRRKQRRA